MSSRGLAWADLVEGPDGMGVPWVAGGVDPAVGLDCKGACWHILRRLWPDFPAPAILGVRSDSASDGGAAAFAEWKQAALGWMAVPVADRLGDLVVSVNPRPPHGPHVDVVVEVGRRTRVLTSLRGQGVVVRDIATVGKIREILRYDIEGRG